MKISSFFIKNFQQFLDTEIDFTNPETSEPADQICLIGRNGTGKSTILLYLNSFLEKLASGEHQLGQWPAVGVHWGFIDSIIKLKVKDRNVYFFYANQLSNLRNPGGNLGIYLNDRFNLDEEFKMAWTECDEDGGRFADFFSKKISPFILEKSDVEKLRSDILGEDPLSNLFVYSPAETKNNAYIDVNDVPTSTLSNALALFKKYPIHHIVSQETIEAFWENLIFLIKKRDNEREVYETQQGNLQKTKQQLIEEFESINPKILEKLSVQWSKILDKAGLEFDFKNARNPVQLNDNLLAYIRIKNGNQKISYNHLSTGIRNYIFRVGHIYSLYFNKKVENGFLLIDEPENSLFPDFLFDLLKIYQGIVSDASGNRNTQIFLSTHNPIVAAQFEPHERIILEWENGTVAAFKGTAPVGDDPNDILVKDFKLKNLMSEKGQKMWQEYLDLRKQLRNVGDTNEKMALLVKINKIGNDYNFEE